MDYDLNILKRYQELDSYDVEHSYDYSAIQEIYNVNNTFTDDDVIKIFGAAKRGWLKDDYTNRPLYHYTQFLAESVDAKELQTNQLGDIETHSLIAAVDNWNIDLLEFYEKEDDYDR